MKSITKAILGGVLWTVLGAPPASAKEILLALDEATTLSFPSPIDTVFIANSELADYQIVKGNRLIVFSKKTGRTSLVVLGDRGATLANRVLVINRSLAELRQQVAVLYPDSKMTLSPLGEQLVLSGVVASESERQGIYTLAGEFLGQGYEEKTLEVTLGEETRDAEFMTRRIYKGLVDNLSVAVVRQVNVKLTIAEVSQSFLRQLGVKWGGMKGDDFLGNGQFTEILSDRINSKDIRNYISAADDDTLGQVLAEPNLSVISGETASFLAGGEMPIVTRIDDTDQVTFKEYGVRLDLAAKVEQDDKIKLTLQPEVSAIDYQFAAEGTPAFKTRRARTTVQLGDGESFILGGLLNSEDREALAKIPLIGDLPVIGALFRHTRNERVKSELIIVATVNLVKPVPAESIQLPQMTVTPSLMRYFNIAPLPPGQQEQQAYGKAQQTLSRGGFRE